MPIQSSLVIQHVWKRKVHTKLQKNTTAAQHTEKATRTTQPEEGKRESDE